MLNSPLTTWFDASVTPLHAGVYRREAPAGPYACWSGSAWFRDAATADAAAAQTAVSLHSAARWRGLRQPPQAPCLTCRGHTIFDRGFDEESGRDLIGECPDC